MERGECMMGAGLTIGSTEPGPQPQPALAVRKVGDEVQHPIRPTILQQWPTGVEGLRPVGESGGSCVTQSLSTQCAPTPQLHSLPGQPSYNTIPSTGEGMGPGKWDKMQ